VVRMIGEECWTEHIGAVIPEFFASFEHAEN
jgi:hypothetical protein